MESDSMAKMKMPTHVVKPRCGHYRGYAIIAGNVKEKEKVKRSAC